MDGRTPASVACQGDSDPNILPLWPKAPGVAAAPPPAAPVAPPQRLWPGRLITTLALVAIVGIWGAHAATQTPEWDAAGAATAACGLLAVAALVCGYWTDPALRRTRTLGRSVRQLSGAIQRWTIEEQQLLTACEQLEHVIREEEEQLEERRCALEAEGRARHVEARRVCQQAIIDAEARREVLLYEHQQELHDLHLEFEAVGAAFRGRLADLSQQGELETAARLAEHQHHFVAERLAEMQVADSDLAEDVQGRLLAAGVQNLAQLTGERAAEAGFHTLQIEALLAWRQGLQRTLRRQTPTELPPEETREMVVRYHAARRELEQERQQAQSRLAAALEDAETRRQAALSAIAKTIEQLQEQWKAYRRAINTTYETRFQTASSTGRAELARRREEFAQASNALLGVQIELAASRLQRRGLADELTQLPSPGWGGYVARVLGWPAAARDVEPDQATVTVVPALAAVSPETHTLRRAA